MQEWRKKSPRRSCGGRADCQPSNVEGNVGGYDMSDDDETSPAEEGKHKPIRVRQ